MASFYFTPFWLVAFLLLAVQPLLIQAIPDEKWEYCYSKPIGSSGNPNFPHCVKTTVFCPRHAKDYMKEREITGLTCSANSEGCSITQGYSHSVSTGGNLGISAGVTVDELGNFMKKTEGLMKWIEPVGFQYSYSWSTTATDSKSVSGNCPPYTRCALWVQEWKLEVTGNKYEAWVKGNGEICTPDQSWFWEWMVPYKDPKPTGHFRAEYPMTVDGDPDRAYIDHGTCGVQPPYNGEPPCPKGSVPLVPPDEKLPPGTEPPGSPPPPPPGSCEIGPTLGECIDRNACRNRGGDPVAKRPDGKWSCPGRGDTIECCVPKGAGGGGSGGGSGPPPPKDYGLCQIGPAQGKCMDENECRGQGKEAVARQPDGKWPCPKQGNNVQCCIAKGSAPPPAPTCRIGKAEGKCIDKNVCQGQGNEAVSKQPDGKWPCPKQGDNVQCCIPKGSAPPPPDKPVDNGPPPPPPPPPPPADEGAGKGGGGSGGRSGGGNDRITKKRSTA